MRLFFHVMRHPSDKLMCGQEPKLRWGETRPSSVRLFSALDMQFRPRFELRVVVRCQDHIPEGAWVEGRDPYSQGPDPEGDKMVAWWVRKIAPKPKSVAS